MSAAETYSVMLNGRQIGAGLSRVAALTVVYGVVDITTPAELVQVDIVEQTTSEKRARWSGLAGCWSVASAPEWLT